MFIFLKWLGPIVYGQTCRFYFVYIICSWTIHIFCVSKHLIKLNVILKMMNKTLTTWWKFKVRVTILCIRVTPLIRGMFYVNFFNNNFMLHGSSKWKSKSMGQISILFGNSPFPWIMSKYHCALQYHCKM